MQLQFTQGKLGKVDIVKTRKGLMIRVEISDPLFGDSACKHEENAWLTGYFQLTALDAILRQIGVENFLGIPDVIADVPYLLASDNDNGFAYHMVGIGTKDEYVESLGSKP